MKHLVRIAVGLAFLPAVVALSAPALAAGGKDHERARQPNPREDLGDLERGVRAVETLGRGEEADHLEHRIGAIEKQVRRVTDLLERRHRESKER